MSLDERQVLEALRGVSYPGFSRDIVSSGVVRELAVEGGTVRFAIELGAGDPALAGPIEQAARAALGQLPGIERVEVRVPPRPRGAPTLRMAGGRSSAAAAGGLDARLIPEVRHVVAVASGKGGVGKSTVAVNLAVALALAGARTGLLDADIYGPSIPTMMGVDEPPRLTPERRLVPFERYGVRFMSLGFLVEPDSAVIWRGPMVMKAVEQLLRDVEWGALDVLVVDMPPGTGDAQLTLSQKVQLAGAVIVTTPQDVALADARKGVAMFRKVGVPVLGIVENMSYFECPHCARRSEIFGHGGGVAEARRLGVPCLGEIPLHTTIRTGSDAGEPVVHARPDAAETAPFRRLAERVLEALAAREAGGGGGLFERFRSLWGGKREP
jgi:ATP-binding protein involved in chromosome partitioning